MDLYKKQYKEIFNPIKIVPLILIIVVFLLTVGYSATLKHFSVDNMKAVFRVDKTIRITGMSYNSSTNNGLSNDYEYVSSAISSRVVLPNDNSTVTYNIEVTNLGNVEMGIHQITGLPSNLEYSLDGYTLEATLCDSNNNSQCTLGSITSFKITIGYADDGYNAENTEYNLSLEFDFQQMVYTAKINDNYYLTIQDAINAAPSDNTETTIVLLRNTYERIKVCAGKNIVLDMPNLVLHNKAFISGNGDPVVEIFGNKDCNDNAAEPIEATFKMINGTIITEANQAAINTEAYGNFIMIGGSIISKGDRQALYINGGTAEISGTSYLAAKALIDISKNNYRGTVHVFTGGNLTVTGGTIESVGGSGIALTNEVNTTIGQKDGNVSIVSPVIIGVNYGIYVKTGSTVNFYDGIVKGKNTAIYNESEIIEKEDSYTIIHSTEEIDNDTYDVASLGQGIVVTFDPQGGIVAENTRVVAKGTAVGSLPTPSKTNYVFDGWYTYEGILVQSSDIVNGNITYYAHWTDIDDAYFAQIGNTPYRTLAEALTAAPANTETTIQLLRNTSEKITINSNKNIVLDLQTYTLSNPDNGVIITNKGILTFISGTIATNGSAAVITNNKTFKMTGGTITTSSASTAAINNSGSSANLTMTGGSIVASGKRQAIYNDNGGTVNISDSAFLSAKAEVASNNKRGTVQNLAGCTLKITGGTIISIATNGIGVTNLGNATIGTKDGNISTTSPEIRGFGIALNNTGSLNFYDGILKGCNTSLEGEINDVEENSEFITSSEIIDGKTYQVKYLVRVSD